MNKLQEIPSVLFIMGAGRCGSTVMSVIIASHPEVESVGEIKSWPRYKGQPRDYDHKNDDLEFWNSVLEQYETISRAKCDFDKLEDICNDIEFNKGVGFLSKITALIFSKQNNKKLQKYYEHNSNLLCAIQKISGKKLILDSSKNVCRAIALLKHPNLNIKVIHLIRDPRGTVWSFMKKDVEQKHKDSLRALLDYFVINSTATMVRYLYKDRVIKVKYEDLVNHPSETIERIFKFIDLDDCRVQSMIGNDAELEIRHIFDGNRVRRNHSIKFRGDDEWKLKLPRIYKILCSIIARPIYLI